MLADRGRPIPALDRDYPDIAVLQIGGLEGHPCVRIDPEWPSLEDSFLVFGYPEEGGAVQRTPARLTYRGTKGTLPTAYLDLASDTIKPGMSGAAVLNLRSGAVCGVVVASKHPAHPDGALAIPWSAIDTDLADVLAANRAFHGQDRRWEEAAAARRERLRFRLPRVVAHFTGREDLLAQLDAALSQRRAGVITQTITGLGGVGKTQLAAAYVDAHQDEFDIAAWVRADDGGTADLAELAVALALPVAGRTPPERASDTLMFLANTDRRWLLVFDNAPGPQALTGLPSSGHGRVLVTSRHRGGYDAFGAELAVDVFDADTARRYLLARSGRSGEETGDADAVAAALGYLPLALAHAGAYCASGTGVPFGEYLELLQDLPSQDLFDTSPEVFYQHTVAATWNTSITAAGQQAPLARPALEMTAYLAPEAIPRSFFAVLEENSAAGRKRVADALTALHRYSLATVDGNRISVHRLLQKVIRDRLTGPDQASAITHALTAIQRALPDDPQLPATWPQWQELVPHVVALASIEAVANLNAAQLVKILNPTCEFLLRSGSNLPALDLATQAVSVSTARLGPDHPDTLIARGNPGPPRTGRRGAPARPSPSCEQLVPDMERLLGPEHPDTLDRPGQPGRLVLVGGAHRRGHRHRRAGRRRPSSGCSAPSTPTPSSPGATWPPCTGRRGAPARPSPSWSGSPPTWSGCSAPSTPTPWTARGNWPPRTGRRGAPARPSPSWSGLPPTWSGCSAPSTPAPSPPGATWPPRTGRRGAPARPSPSWSGLPPTWSGCSAPTTPAPSPPGPTWPPRTRSAGRTGEAIAILERVAADMERLLGPEHPDTLDARGNLAMAKTGEKSPTDLRNQALTDLAAYLTRTNHRFFQLGAHTVPDRTASSRSHRSASPHSA